MDNPNKILKLLVNKQKKSILATLVWSMIYIHYGIGWNMRQSDICYIANNWYSDYKLIIPDWLMVA